MGVYDGITEALSPHAKLLGDRVSIHGGLIHQKLTDIENRISDLGKVDWGDRPFKIIQNGKLKSGITQLAQVPMNEIWPIQFLTVGQATANPELLFEAGGILMFAAKKNTLVNEKFGGDIAFLSGEVITVNNTEAEGEPRFTLIVNRILIPSKPDAYESGPANEGITPINTHEQPRDVIGSPTGQWRENPPEVVPMDAIPDVVQPTPSR